MKRSGRPEKAIDEMLAHAVIRDTEPSYYELSALSRIWAHDGISPSQAAKYIEENRARWGWTRPPHKWVSP